MYSVKHPTVASTISSPPVHEEGDRCWWNGLYGMTELPIEELVVGARSWATPAALQVGRGDAQRRCPEQHHDAA